MRSNVASNLTLALLASLHFYHSNCCFAQVEAANSASVFAVAEVSNELSRSQLVSPEPSRFADESSVFFQSESRDRTAKSSRHAGFRDIFPLFGGDASLEGVTPVANMSQSYGIYWFFEYDAFMGVPDAGWENNGLRAGFNFANKLGSITERTGICSQIGASVGVYDWAGTDYRMQNTDRAETQGFFTYGLFRRPTEASGFVGGIVQDWSFNDTYGVFGQNPVLSQLRGQAGYAINASNDHGFMGATPLMSSHRNVDFFGETTWRSIGHLSWYWHHKWNAGGPDTWLTIGVPSHSRLAGEGSVGDYMVSATSNCPLNDALSLVAGVMYMHPSGSPGPLTASDETWNLNVGLNIYPRRNARNATVAGSRAMPLLSVGNNSSFIVDTNKSY
jgi:hypothetical protein